MSANENERSSVTTEENNATSPSYESMSFYTKQVFSNFYYGLNVSDYMKPSFFQEILKDPITHNEEIRELSLQLYGSNGAYTHAVDYMQALPTLSRVVVTHGKSKSKKDKNRDLMMSTLLTIKDQEIMRDALWRDMVEGACFYYFETNKRPNWHKKYLSDFEVGNICEINEFGVNASIISLPAKYTRIVGLRNSSYVIAFDLSYFSASDNDTTERKLSKMPKEIRDAYIKRSNGNGSIVGSPWYVLDNSKTIVHKIRSKREEPYGRPLVMAAISDILYSDYFTKTKRNVLDDINNHIIYETFPEGKDKGTSALTQTKQQEQHNVVKNAVTNKNNVGGVTFVSVAAGTKLDKLDISNTDIFDEKNESSLSDKIALDLGIAAALLNGVGSGSYAAQQQNLELITAQLLMWIEQISAELNKCIAANIIKDKKNWVEVKYLPITHANKKEMVGYMKDLYLQGKGSLSLWAAACGIAPDVFFALLDQELEEDIENKYPTHATSFTMSKSDTGGRPPTDNPTENTIKSQGNNGNSMPSPSDK